MARRELLTPTAVHVLQPGFGLFCAVCRAPLPKAVYLRLRAKQGWYHRDELVPVIWVVGHWPREHENSIPARVRIFGVGDNDWDTAQEMLRREDEFLADDGHASVPSNFDLLVVSVVYGGLWV